MTDDTTERYAPYPSTGDDPYFSAPPWASAYRGRDPFPDSHPLPVNERAEWSAEHPRLDLDQTGRLPDYLNAARRPRPVLPLAGPIKIPRRPSRHRGPNLTTLLVAFVCAATVLAALGLLGHAYGIPAGVFTDQGIAACEKLAAPEPPPSPHLSIRTQARAAADGRAELAARLEAMRHLRGMFAQSRHDDLKEGGVRFADLAAQVLQDPTASALVLATAFTSAYATLAGACAAHDVPLPDHD